METGVLFESAANAVGENNSYGVTDKGNNLDNPIFLPGVLDNFVAYYYDLVEKYV